MRPFKFRAMVALQLRRREHDRALALLAAAQTALNAAHQALETADARLALADVDATQAMRDGGGNHQVQWYRSWRVRLRGERDACDAHRQTQQLELERAEAVVAEARQKVRSLERLHDRALAAWQQEAQAEEQKLMDALGTLRFSRQERAAS